ncbi:TetR/AcrR family transcriptional regulator [Streptacidiphilus sp. EB129]|uniref:TetR/AcrR family transcriptional regulator n=1 Tax=Streptacidiphilus sp. EB129 TaxID=3156262 RepID=UPI0035152ACA
MVATVTRGGTPRLRADATRNRERIVAAAQEAFIELGAEAPLDEIARRAGIGNATLYRHFPDRRDLVRSVVLAVLKTMSDEAEAISAAAPDAFSALEGFVHGAVEWKVGALCPMLSEWMDLGETEILAARDRLDAIVGAVVERAQAEHSLRTDVGPGDIMIIVAHIARPLPDTNPTEHLSFVHRHLQIVLDGLRTPQPSVLPGRAATLDDLRERCASAGGSSAGDDITKNTIVKHVATNHAVTST